MQARCINHARAEIYHAGSGPPGPPASVCFNSGCELSDADESAPDSRKKCADQNIDRIVAKRTAVSAHLDTNTSDFMLAGGVEQAGENN
jgi:hypothetical protein